MERHGSTASAMTRRQLLAAPLVSYLARGAVKDTVTPAALPFPLTQVRLLESAFLKPMNLNRAYLHDLDADRLLHTFRLNAGIPSKVKPLGGWEKPDVELRGHFTGHYLSACALMSAASPDAALRQKAGYVVNALAECQKAHGNGYLSAFPESFFTRLRNGQKVWAPFYTLHKIMAGLIDQYTLCGNEQALQTVLGMASWIGNYTKPLSDADMARIEKVEFGGTNEALYNLYAITGDAAHMELAHRFDQTSFFDPLAAGRDELKGLHVNTHIPKVIGAARRYELTGEPRYRDIAAYFWAQTVGHHSYVTGGTSNGELWRTGPDEMASQLGPTTQECCCTYNMLKLTRHLFQWTGDARYADYYERALFNGILGTMDPQDGMTMYYVPLDSGYWKIFGRPLDSFWCCTGTGTESFSKLADSIYFHDENGLWVNLFIASTLEWPERQFRLRQQTRFPDEATSTLAIEAAPATPLKIRVRVPGWAREGVSVRVNGRAVASAAKPGTYLTLERVWKAGDRVEWHMPMSLRIEAMPDDASLQAILYGPVVLAGDLGADGITNEVQHGDTFAAAKDHPGLRATAPEFKAAGDPSAWIRRDGGNALIFHTTGQERDVRLIPLNRIFDQRYAVYWRVRPPLG